MGHRPSSGGVWALSSDCIHPCKEFDERTDRLQLVLPQSAQLLLAELPFVQESPKQLREPRIATVILAVRSLYGVRSCNFPNPADPPTPKSRWPFTLFSESLCEAPNPEQRRRLCGRWPFLTSTKSVRSGWNRRLASTGCSSACPPSRHPMPWHGAVSTGVDPFTMADSTFTSRGCTSILNLNRSFTGFPRFCLQPRYRSVVCTDACPSKN